MLYRLVRPLLYTLPAEPAHHVGFGVLKAMQAVPGGTRMARRLCMPEDPALEVEAFGLRFPNPVGLAAGFDKNAEGFEALGALGFGHVEVGTLTGQAQAGNPKPRLFRLPRDRAVINRMGFNNRGSADAVARLERARHTIVGINIGKTKVVAEDAAIDDYVLSTRRLGHLADYFVVNVSSPNTPGLRDLQAVEKLRPLLSAVRAELDARVPLLVKIAPDLADEDIDAVADLALELKLHGIIATNTTISRAGLRTDAEPFGAGGLSGAPLKERSSAVLRRLRSRVGTNLTLVAVGGIENADDAWERIVSGASLVQLYTAFIYEGPLLARRIALGLLERAKSAGFERVQDAVGTAS